MAEISETVEIEYPADPWQVRDACNLAVSRVLSTTHPDTRREEPIAPDPVTGAARFVATGDLHQFNYLTLTVNVEIPWPDYLTATATCSTI
jgi:hypothetical protein